MMVILGFLHLVKIMRRNGAVFFLLSSVLLTPCSAYATLIRFYSSGADSIRAQQKSRRIGPGVWYHESYRPDGPWAINVIEIDRRSPYLCFETVKARNLLHGVEKTSVMAAAADAEPRPGGVVAAINGDFFDATGMPINLQVRRGEMLRGPSAHSVFAITAEGAPMIEVFSASYHVRTVDGVWRELQGFNRPRHTDETILYTHHFGATTATNAFGSEARLQLLSSFFANDTLRGVVLERHTNTGNSSLAQSVVVVSAHGAAQRWLDAHVTPGDTLLMICDLSGPAGRLKIVEALGGLPRIVRDGKVSVETDREGGAKLANVRHPRTAIGFSTDSSRIFLVTVDGRQPHSEGMTLDELADFMISLGCAQALNLDGGGSTTMVVRGKVANHPSDATGERPVGNALLLISQAPPGPVATLSIEPGEVICPVGETIDFAAVATDTFCNPLSLGDNQFSWQVSRQAGLGRIDGKGKFTAQPSLMTAAAEDSGYVLVRRGALRDSAKVVVTTWRELQLAPDSLYLQIGAARALQATLVDGRGRIYKKPPAEFRWFVEGNIGKISTTGVFTATANGRGYVRARFKKIEGKIPVLIAPKPF